MKWIGERFEASPGYYRVVMRDFLIVTSEANAEFAGLPIYINYHLPDDMALMFDSAGKMQVLKLRWNWDH